MIFKLIAFFILLICSMAFLQKKGKHEAHPQILPVITSPEGLICVQFLVHVESIGDTRSGIYQHLLSFPGKRIEGFQILSTLPGKKEGEGRREKKDAEM
jgi:hypothetical protein